MNIRIELIQEIPTSDNPALIIVHENGQLVAEIVAKVELKPGADGGYYNCVTLEKK